MELWKDTYRQLRLTYRKSLNSGEVAFMACQRINRRRPRMSNRAGRQNSIAYIRRMGEKRIARRWLADLLESSRIWNKFKLY